MVVTCLEHLTFNCSLQISRMLAAKTALAARVDALGVDSGTAMGIENRAKLEMRLKSLEENQVCKKLPSTIHLLSMAQVTFSSHTCDRLSLLDIACVLPCLAQRAGFCFKV